MPSWSNTRRRVAKWPAWDEDAEKNMKNKTTNL
jgi:hypothetical protein